MIFFGPDTTNQRECTEVTITDDGDFEQAETFTIELIIADAPLGIDAARNLATVTIIDSDGELIKLHDNM